MVPIKEKVDRLFRYAKYETYTWKHKKGDMQKF